MASTKTLSKALGTAALALSLTGIAHAQENTEAIQAEPAASAPAATPATPAVAASAPAPAPKVETESAKPKCGLSWRSAIGALIASGLDKTTRSAGAGDMAQIIISPGCSRKLEP